MVDKIESFTGEYRWLSNFWPCGLTYEGVTYPSVEHAYQAAKSLNDEERITMSLLSRPGDAKRYGKKLTLRPDWEQVKVSVMRELLKLKFASPFDGLGVFLRNTNDSELVEGNTWGDTIWGVCNGVGENLLGKLLMERREHLQSLYGEWEGAMEGG